MRIKRACLRAAFVASRSCVLILWSDVCLRGVFWLTAKERVPSRACGRGRLWEMEGVKSSVWGICQRSVCGLWRSLRWEGWKGAGGWERQRLLGAWCLDHRQNGCSSHTFTSLSFTVFFLTSRGPTCPVLQRPHAKPHVNKIVFLSKWKCALLCLQNNVGWIRARLSNHFKLLSVCNWGKTERWRLKSAKEMCHDNVQYGPSDCCPKQNAWPMSVHVKEQVQSLITHSPSQVSNWFWNYLLISPMFCLCSPSWVLLSRRLEQSLPDAWTDSGGGLRCFWLQKTFCKGQNTQWSLNDSVTWIPQLTFHGKKVASSKLFLWSLRCSSSGESSIYIQLFQKTCLHTWFFNDITTIMAPHLLFTLCVEHYIDCLGVEKAVNLDIFSYKKVNRSLWYLFFIVFFSLWVSNWFLSMSSDQQKLPSPIENTAAETPRLYFCDFVTSLYITIYRN